MRMQKIINRLKITETGRSMVEMLAVLVIVGILTVASFWGYRFSLSIIMSNSIVTGVRARSIVIGQQRVLERPLNLHEFIDSETGKDLIYGRFEVKAYNDYKNTDAAEASKYQSDIVTNCAIGDGVQVMEVFDVPYDVCEYIKGLDFPDPTCNTINGQVYGKGSVTAKCIADEPPAVPNEDGLVGRLEGEFKNILAYVFDDGVGSYCNVNVDCPTNCCVEQKCVRVEECPCDPCQERDAATGNCVPRAKGKTCDVKVPCCCDGEGRMIDCGCEEMGGEKYD